MVGAAKRPGEPGQAQRNGADGDPLPPGAIARLGGLRLQHGGGISNVLFTRDSKGLISAGGEAVIRLWDPATGKEIRHFTGHEDLNAELFPDALMSGTLPAGARHAALDKVFADL